MYTYTFVYDRPSKTFHEGLTCAHYMWHVHVRVHVLSMACFPGGSPAKVMKFGLTKLKLGSLCRLRMQCKNSEGESPWSEALEVGAHAHAHARAHAHAHG